MAFFKNFQQHLPSVSSLVGTISSVVEDLTTAVGDVSCALTDSVAEQVTSMINGFRPEEENSAAEEVIDNSKQKNAMLPEVTKDANCQKTQSSSEHRAKQINCFTSFSQKHEAMHEEGVLERVNCRQQTLSKYQETSNADDSSLKGHVGNGTSALKQSTWAGSPCQALESTDRCKITNSKDRLHGKIKEQINPAKYYKVKGPTKTKKNEAIWAKKGTAQSKDEKYSKIIPEKDNSYMDQDEHGSSSESEDEALGRYHEALSRTHNSRLPLADSRQKSYAWETRQKYSPLSAEYDGYSSEASIDEGGHINLPFSTTTRKRMASKRKFSRKSKH